MAIIETITDDYHFWFWIKKSDSYSNNFTVEGAKALQAYLDELSEDIGENMEFDPVAWCVEYSEYKDFANFLSSTGYTHDEYKNWQDVMDVTTVIDFDGGHIVQDF